MLVAVVGLTSLAPGLTGAVLTDQVAPGSNVVASIGTYPQRVKALNPLGYWRLNDASAANGATAADASGNNRNGTYAGGLHLTTRAPNYTSGNGYVYASIGVNATYTVAVNDRFEYDMLIDNGSSYQAVDIVAANGATLRDGGYVDQDGKSSHAAYYSAPAGTWVHRTFALASGTPLVGQTINSVLLVSEADTAAAQGVYYTNIRITDTAGNIKKVFWGNGDPEPSATIAYQVTAGSVATVDAGWNGMVPANVPSPLVMWGGSGPVTRYGGIETEVKVTDPALDMASANAFTLEAWVNSSALSWNGSGFVARQKNGQQEQYGLDYWQGNTRFFVRNTAGTVFVVNGPSINNGQWHQVVGVFSAGTLTLYIDGVSAGSTSGATGGLLVMPGGTPTTIAARGDASAGVLVPNGTIGALAEVAIYPTALTPSQVTDHWVRR